MKRTVAIVAAILAGVVVATLIAAGLWMFQSHSVDSRVANEALERARARFQGIAPAFEVRGREMTAVRQPPAGPVSPPRSVHVLIWETDRGKLSSVTIPFWILALTTEPIPLRGIELRASDLKQYGQTLLLDGVVEGNARIIAWAD